MPRATEPLAPPMARTPTRANMSPSIPSSSSSARSANSANSSNSFAAYVSAAKRQPSDLLRASVSSTASTTSSSTRASDAGSSRSGRRLHSNNDAADDNDDAFRDIATSLARHETAVRRRAQLRGQQQQQQQLTQHESVVDEQEQDPDFLPSDSKHYKLEATRRKKKRARRIKLKHYGLAKQAAKLNNLSGFLLHSITPRESSILTYTSMATPGTHTEYDVVVENFRAGLIWQVSRRYSTFRLLREELIRPFQVPHCHYCASIMRDMQKIDVHFPGKRLWGSTSPSVVRARAERFQKYLRGLLDIATAGYKLNCPLVANIFVVQLRNFLTSDSVRYTGIPGQFGQQIPCLLHELSTSGSPHDPMTTLQTIQEHSSRSSRGSILEDVDERDLRERLRRAEDHDVHYMFASADNNNSSSRGNGYARGIDAYLIDEDDDEDDDGDDDDDDELIGDFDANQAEEPPPRRLRM